MTANTSKWVLLITGLFLCFIYTRALVLKGLSLEYVVFLFLSLLIVSNAFIFHTQNAWSPKVVVGNDLITFKAKLWRSAKSINWDAVKAIKLEANQVIFNLVSGEEALSYNCHSEVSKNIKRLIREFAEKKGIEVSGG